MVAKNTSYGSETYRPYLDIERIINVQSACSVTRGHDPKFNIWLRVRNIISYTLLSANERNSRDNSPGSP